MMKQSFFFVLIIGIILACGSSPKDDKLADPGAKIFKKNCMLCHGMDGKSQMNGAKDLTLSEMPLDERVHLITNGRTTMTPFKGLLSEKEIELVAKYTMKFNKNLK